MRGPLRDRFRMSEEITGSGIVARAGTLPRDATYTYKVKGRSCHKRPFSYTIELCTVVLQ